MEKESTQIKVISIIITLMALIAIIARIMKPTMMIDSVTLWLIAIAIVPWLAPLIKSIEWGGAKIEFQERLKKLEADTTNMHAEMENMAHTLNDMLQDPTTVSKLSSNISTSPLKLAFVHIATSHNTTNNYTTIDNPLTNKNPNAILMVTQNWNPPTSRGKVYNPRPVGVWYTEDGYWSIFNENRELMPHGAAFNVQVLTQGE